MEPNVDENITMSCRRKSKTNSIPDQPQNLDETPMADGILTDDSSNEGTRVNRGEDFNRDLVDVSLHPVHPEVKIEPIFVDTNITPINITCSPRIFEVSPICSDASSSSNSNTLSTNRTKNRKARVKRKKATKGSNSSSRKVRSTMKTRKRKAEDLSVKKSKYEYPRLCPGCHHAYKTKQSFWNHKQRCPLLPQNMCNKLDANGLPIEGAANGELAPRKEYICAHCERHYRKKYNLREHLKNTCRGKPCSKGRLQCWVVGCLQAFYKYVDLVQHVTIKHGQDLQVQKLQFPNLNSFNTWKMAESNSKFMYARKITGSKRFSNTKYHYFVCQFNHRNEKKNSNRKTSRRKKDSLVVPNYNCPSRIMVKECEDRILVTYISSHNHELNLANVKYQPLEKEARGYIKTLLQLGVTPQKIIEHLRAGVGIPEIDSFLATKQYFLTLGRIKRMESKLKAKSRVREKPDETEARPNAADDSDSVADDSFPPCETIKVAANADGAAVLTTLSFSTDAPAEKKSTPKANPAKEPNEVIRSIESNLKKLKGYLHKNTVKEKLSTRISAMIQELCDECEIMDEPGPAPPARKPRVRAATRKRKSPTAKKAKAAGTIKLAPSQTVSTAAPTVTVATITAAVPGQAGLIVQPIVIQQSAQMSDVDNPEAPAMISLMGENRIVESVANACIAAEPSTRYGTSFTPAIDESSDLLKPVFQPFNVNLLALKSIDRHISEHEKFLLQQMDNQFVAGWMHDTVLNAFLNLVCGSSKNVLAVDTSITEYVPVHRKLPEVWRFFDWSNIDTIFIPCNPSKKQWILMVVLVKQLEVQILDPTGSFDDAIFNIYKKHEATIQCWYEVLRTYLGLAQWNVTSPQHNKHPDPVHSGVLVCWFVMQYINKHSLVDSVDLDCAFRQFIYNTVVNNSSAV